MPLTRAPLRRLARQRRSLHAEGLLALAATAGLVAAAQMGARLLAIAPAALLYAALTVGWVVRYLDLHCRESLAGPAASPPSAP